MRDRPYVVAAGILGVSCAGAWAQVDLSQYRFQTIAVSGQALPGSSVPTQIFDSVTFGVSTTPTLSRDGRVLFPQPGSGEYIRDAYIGGPLTQFFPAHGVLVGENPNESGNSAPGYEAPMFAQMDGQGHIVGGSPGQGGLIVNKITSASPLVANLLARNHVPPPGMPSNLTWEQIAFPTLKPDGTVFFYAKVGSNDDKLWTWNTSGVPTLLLDAHTPAPGMPGFAVENYFRNGSSNRQGPVVNASGQMLVGGKLDTSGPGVTLTNRDVVWKGTPGALTPLMRRGSPLPNGDPVFMLSQDDLEINGAGDVAGFVQTGTTSGTGKLMVMRGGTVSYLARGGQQGPGMNPGEFWDGGGVFGNTVMNHGGRVAFTGLMNNSTGATGIWFGDESNLQMIVRPGTMIPGFGSAHVLSAYRGIALNALDDLVFTVRLDGGPGDTIGMVHWSPTTGLQGLLKTGDLLQTGPGVLKAISSFSFTTDSGGEDGRPISLDDARNFAFATIFSDGTGGAYTMVVPSPGAALPLIGLGIVARRRRR